MSNNHTYSRKEITRILKKASEIQTEKDLYGDKDGLSENELLELAAETGIDKASLLEALEAFDSPEFDKKFKLSKLTSKIQDIAYVKGQISDENWEEIIHEIRKVTGGIGKTTVTKNSYEWEQRKEFGYKHISLFQNKEKVKVQYVSNWKRQKFTSLGIPTFFGSILLLFLLEALGLPKATTFTFAPLGGIVGLIIGISFIKQKFKSEMNKTKTLISSISKQIQKSSPQISIEDEDVYKDESITQNSDLNNIKDKE